MIQRIRQEKMLQSTSTTLKKSSFQSLKQAKEQFSKQIKLRSKKMKKQKFLKQEIYKNHNIFHSLTNVNHFSKTMTAQNIIWTKNYELKEGINKLKEENSSLKARIWNVEKENRKMDRQIETWGLKKTLGSGVVGNCNGKPYIDTATAQKVLNDQDYSITSIKIMIMQMEQQLQNLTQTLQSSLVQKKNIRNIRNDMKHEINSKKVEMWKGFLWNETSQKYNEEQLQAVRQQKREQLVEKNQELEFIVKNTEMKRKTRVTLEEELAKISGELDGLSDISKEKIAVLQEQARKLRTEDESYVNEEVKKLANVKQRYLQFECKTQDKMGQFIKRKIQINKEMTKLTKKLLKLDTSTKQQAAEKSSNNLIQPGKLHSNPVKPKETQPKQINNLHNNRERNLVVDLLQGKVVEPDREVYYEAYLGKAQFLKDNKTKSMKMDD